MYPTGWLYRGLLVAVAIGIPPAWAAEVSLRPAGDTEPVLAVRYFAQIGVGHAGRLRFDTDFVFINSGVACDFVLDFFDSTGEPLSVLQFRGEQSAYSSSLQTRLEQGETLNLSIRRDGGLRAGFARLTTCTDVSGVIAFTRTDVREQKIEYQAGVPLSPVLRDFTVPVKFVPGVGDMGFALVNPEPNPSGSMGDGAARVRFRLYDEAFNLHGTAETTLPPGAHLAQFIAELFPQMVDLAEGVGFNGSMTVESNRALAAISVLHTEVPTLTTVPVTAGRADRAAVAAGVPPATLSTPESR